MLENLIKPSARRIGTYLAGALGGIVAMNPEQLASLEVALTSVTLIGLDLLLSKVSRSGWF